MKTGVVWRRKEPKGDPFDEVVVRGFYNDDPTWREVVVSPLSFGETISTPPQVLQAHYTSVADQESEALAADIEAWGDRLEELAAHG